MTRARDISNVITNADLAGDIDVDGTANLDVVDIDGAVDMASTLTLAGNADFNGDLDVDGTSNLDAVDIDLTLNVAGETTLQSHLNMGDNDKIKLGASGDLEVYHDGSNSFVDDTGTGNLFLRGESQVIIGNMTGEQAAVFNDDGAVTLNHDNSAKLATTSSGVDVTGTLNATSGLQINGVDLATGGAVKQVVSSTQQTRTIVNGSSFVTVHSASITPTASSSKILVMTSYQSFLGGTNTSGNFELLIHSSVNGEAARTQCQRSSGVQKALPSQFNTLDNPNTTSSVTYSIQARRESGSDSFPYCENSRHSVIIMMEISQ